MTLTYPLHAIHVTGCVEHIDDEAAARTMSRRFGHKHVIPHTILQDHPHLEIPPTRHDWIVRDDWGRLVTHGDLPETERTPWWLSSHDRARAAAERGLAIPGTGRRHGMRRRRIRGNPAAMAATMAVGDDLDAIGLGGLNACRRREHQDTRMTRYRTQDRCWKKQRRTQWA